MLGRAGSLRPPVRRSSSALVVALLCAAAMMESVVASTVERADSSTTSDPSPLIRTISATGWLDVDFNPDVMQAMGLTVTGQSRSHLRLPLLPGADPLQVKLGDGAPTAAGKGGLRVEGDLPSGRWRHDAAAAAGK